MPRATSVLHAHIRIDYRVQTDNVLIELVATWKKANPSVVLRAFLELIDTNAAQIRSKAELH